MFDYLKNRIDFKVFGITYLISRLISISMIHYCNTGEIDSPLEQIAEDIIEFNTGIRVDLTPTDYP